MFMPRHSLSIGLRHCLTLIPTFQPQDERHLSQNSTPLGYKTALSLEGVSLDYLFSFKTTLQIHTQSNTMPSEM